jgi:L-threonylcarbamoyladenylate synthase
VSRVDEAVAALREGALVVLPTDTVYGLACLPEREASVRELSRVKGRPPEQPVALLAGSGDALLALVPEVGERAERALRALVPGPFTLVLENPARRFPWLAGARPETIGVRVPELAGPAAELLRAVGAVAATSANRHGAADPRSVEELDPEIAAAAAVVLDGGELPGTPSTVVDLTGSEPSVLREGAVPRAEALARVAAILGE